MTKEIEKIIKKVQGEADKKNERRFDGMMEVINEKFKIIQEQFSAVFEKLDNISMDMTEIRSDIKDTPFQIKFLRDFKLDKKHFVGLESRVRVLEKNKK